MLGPPSSPPVLRSAAASAAAAPGLLPAFAPSSSPQPMREFLRPKFAIYQDPVPQPAFLPTPLPTSEANAPASSSPPVSPVPQTYRLAPPMESKPLQPLIVARVPLSGTSVTLGRSSKSSTFALRARNKLASRVHAKLSVRPDNFVAIECLGWNGLTVSVPQESGGREDYEVARSQVLNVERMDGITIDVHGDKALIEFNNDAEETEEEIWKQADEELREQNAEHYEGTAQKRTNENSAAASPAKRRRGSQNEPADNVTAVLSSADLGHACHAESSSYAALAKHVGGDPIQTAPRPLLGAPLEVPTGTRLEVPKLAPFKLASPEPSVAVTTPAHSPAKPLLRTAADVTKESATQPSLTPRGEAECASQNVANGFAGIVEKRKRYQELGVETRRELENVAVNFIAFSRLSAVPLATVRKASTQLKGLPKTQVRELIRQIKCIGVTDAQRDDAGRLPDDEYYYVPELDTDESRRTIVQTSRSHRSLRSCRKTRKQYFYRPLNLAE